MANMTVAIRNLFQDYPLRVNQAGNPLCPECWLAQKDKHEWLTHMKQLHSPAFNKLVDQQRLAKKVLDVNLSLVDIDTDEKEQQLGLDGYVKVDEDVLAAQRSAEQLKIKGELGAMWQKYNADEISLQQYLENIQTIMAKYGQTEQQ